MSSSHRRSRRPARRACLLALAGALAAGGGAVVAAPAGADPVLPSVNTRTSVAVKSPVYNGGTANAGETRPGLSIVKLYIVDYALRHGDGSASDRALAERAVRASDDAAAAELYAKYPNSIDATAREYGLTATRGNANWGYSKTSAADAASFLRAKQLRDPSSPILHWMETAEPVAADGTRQNWGTDNLPFVTGTKWGWSDEGPSVVASASVGGSLFSVAAITYGSPEEQTGDVLAYLPPLPAVPGSAPLSR
ncbi:hypothetical protein [Corynebacterium sp.]|uniref:hypothetical protein n=1 Tax=Corynebacterium sp. TaxID=1720 RepID=UPI0025C686D5|nr:hypothetical protein [Corynebacterium sp.]